jgi:hypothetical protein
MDIKAGSTSRRIPVFIQDTSKSTGVGLAGLAYNSTNLVCYYWREDEGNAGATAVTLASATRGTFTSSGFVEKDATNLPGHYEFGIPNAAIATGAKWVSVQFRDTGTALNLLHAPLRIDLVAYDPFDATTLGLGNLDAAVSSRSTVTTAQVNAEVVDALNVDTYAEPGQEAPPATTTLVKKLGYLYKAWRNRVQQTATTYKLYNDDAATVDQKATTSDDGTTFERTETASGP